MSFPLPTSLSPSKVSAFKACALSFRFSAIDRLPEAPSPQAVKGTLVHRALELLMWEEPAGRRSLRAALAKLAGAVGDLALDPDYLALQLDGEAHRELVDDAAQLIRNYFELEDPDAVRVMGTELMLSAELGDVTLRGIIDRLELDDDGGLVVTDYKTGRAPGPAHEQARLGGVEFYAFLCQQMLGRRPVRVQLLHLREPLALSAVPSGQSMQALSRRAAAIWAAVERACLEEDFQPRPGPLCQFCGFQAHCPAWGGDSSPPPVQVPTPAGARRPAPAVFTG